MITEDYVSFETAKLLKEKGFDGKSTKWYFGVNHINAFGREVPKDEILECSGSPIDNKHVGEDSCVAPTLQMAIKWLREEHNLAIATYLKADGWHSGVSQIKFNGEGFIVDIIDGIDNGNIPNCDTYEEACEAAMKYCVENKLIF